MTYVCCRDECPVCTSPWVGTLAATLAKPESEQWECSGLDEFHPDTTHSDITRC